MDGFKKKSKKGQVGFISLMLGFVLFVLGLALAPVLNDVITGDEVMGENGLNCSNPNITNQDKAVCYQTDSIQPLFIGLVFGLAGILIGRIVL